MLATSSTDFSNIVTSQESLLSTGVSYDSKMKSQSLSASILLEKFKVLFFSP